MATAADLELEIRKLTGTAQLQSFWIHITAKTLPPLWHAGKAFEYLVIRAFEDEGVSVRYPYPVQSRLGGTLEQVDGALILGERTFLVESKDHATPVDIGPVAKLRLRLAGRPPGTLGIVFSTSDFSPQTDLICQFLQPLDVLLWGKSDFTQALAARKMRASLEKKVRVAVEEGWSNWPVP